MTKQYMTSKNKKKQRLKITNLNDLKQALLQEGYTEIDFEENTFKDSISKNFKVSYIISITEFSKHEGPYLMNKVTEEIDVTRVEDTNGISLESGHGGGDGGIVAAIYEDFNGVYEGCSLSTARDSYRNHLLSWAAEESRLAGGKVIDLDEFAAQH